MRSTPQIKTLAGRPRIRGTHRTALTIVFAMLLVACEPANVAVGSLQPLYGERDRSIVFEPRLLGTWDKNPGSVPASSWTFEQIEGEDAYTLTDRRSDGGTGVYRAVLVRLDGLLVLDLSPVTDEPSETYGSNLLRLHTFHRVWLDSDVLREAWLADIPLKSILDQRRGEIRHERFESSPQIILTASPDELQRFVTRHAAELFYPGEKEKASPYYRRENQAYLRSLEDQLQLNASDADALESLGMEYLRQGHYNEARDTLQRAVNLEPQDSDHRGALAFAWLYLKDPVEARNALPDEWKIDCVLAITYFHERRFAETTQSFESCFAREGYDTQLGMMYVVALEFSSSRLAVEDALKKFPPGNSWDAHVHDYFRDQINDEQLLRQARNDVRECQAHFLIGMRRLAQGDHEGGHAHFQKSADTRAFGTLAHLGAVAFL